MKKLNKVFTKHMAKYEKYKKFWKENKGIVKEIESIKGTLFYDICKEHYEDLEALKDTDPMAYAKLVYKEGVRYKCASNSNDSEIEIVGRGFKLLKNGDIEAEYEKGMLRLKGKWAEIVEEEKPTTVISTGVSSPIEINKGEYKTGFETKITVESPNTYHCKHSGQSFKLDNNGQFEAFGYRIPKRNIITESEFHGVNCGGKDGYAYFKTEQERTIWIEQNK